MCLSIEIKRPDDVLSKGKHLGFEWVTVSNGRGYRCGYVRVPKGHPWHGSDNEEVPAIMHGGCTFAEADVSCDKPGDDDAWWIGFDCAHAGDAPDSSLKVKSSRRDTFLFNWPDDGIVRDQKYVESECRSICKQAAAAA